MTVDSWGKLLAHFKRESDGAKRSREDLLAENFDEGIVVVDDFGQPVERVISGDRGSVVRFPIVSQFDAMHNEPDSEQRKRIIENNRINCFPVEFRRFYRTTFDTLDADFDENALAQAQMFVTRVSHDTEGGLVLYGEPGTGKTALAAAICNAITDAGRKCRMTTLGALIDRRYECKCSTQRAIEPYVTCDLTVIDDVDSDITSGRTEICEDILAALAGSGQRLLFTTNLTLAQLSEPKPAAKRVVGRIVEAGRLVAVTGQDRRQVRFGG